MTQQHLKHTSNEMQITARSSYRDNYTEIDKEELVKPRKLGLEVAAIQKNMGLKSNNAPFAKESLTKRDYADFSGRNLMSREKRRHDGILDMKNVGNHYLTNHQANYVSHQTKPDHRTLRKQFDRVNKPI